MLSLTGPHRQRIKLGVGIVLVAQLLVSMFAVTASRKPSDSWPMTVAVVGGSFAAGDMNRVVWPTLLAQRTGWAVSNFALPGAGFAADGLGGHAFTYQVDRAAAAHPRIVLIATGNADNGLADMGRVSVGARDAINKVTLSGERALVIGPTWFEKAIPPEVRRVSEAVQAVAVDAGVPFLDALDPPWLTRDLMKPDLSGPTDDGQSVIADKVAAWLRSEVNG